MRAISLAQTLVFLVLLAGIDVRHDADIAIPLERSFSGHSIASDASHHR
jgi:hypothetical protein